MAPAAQEDSSSSVNRPVVVLTGYGLFRDYTSNSSKEVVEKIAATGIEGLCLRSEILPVEYDFVKKRTQELYEEHRPILTIHCGMYSDAKAVIMEQVARNTGYDVADVRGAIPCSNRCEDESISSDFLKTSLDLEKIVAECKTAVPVYISRDAGLYLCEYIYYCALTKCERSLFIHIPAVNAEHPLEKLVETVKRIIVLAVEQCERKSDESS